MKIGSISRAQERKEYRSILRSYRRMHDGLLDPWVASTAKRISKKMARSVREK